MSYTLADLLSLVLALVAGLFVGYLIGQRRKAHLLQENTRLTAIHMATQEKMLSLQQSRDELSRNFAALSSQALKHNSEEFLKLAQEKLSQFHILASSELGQKEKAIETLLTPIKEALHKTEQQMHAVERDRKEAYGSIAKHLEGMTQTQFMLQQETRNLVTALRRPEVRGQWGELTLRRLVELAGMVSNCDFFEQAHLATSEGALRPDMIVRLPGQRDIIVDVKTPLDAYLSALETEGAIRTQHLEHHARKVRERIKALASKAYWNQFKNSADFVVMFIPGDPFLSAALDIDPAILESALQQKVMLATPTSFVALLRVVALCWQQQALAENAEQIRDVGTELYGRLATFTEHLGKLGRQLGGTLESYNSAVGSFERNVLPGARKFAEMGISTQKSLEPLDQIEKKPRPITVE